MLQGNCLAQDALPPLAFLHHPVTGEGEVDALHYATLMKAIDTAGLESVDSFTGLHNFNESLGEAGNADLWLAVAVPHNQYNNWLTIYWYAVNTKMERSGI